MGDRQEMMQAFEAAMKSGDFGALTGLVQEYATDDFVQEWPQSGERIRGRDNAMAINQNYPGFPTSTVRRVLAAGDLVTSEVVLDYGGQIYQGVSVFEFRDGRIVMETDYFAQPFQAPSWRARWVERT